MKKNKSLGLGIILLFMPIIVFSQEMTNKKYQKIIIIDGENKNWLAVYVDHLHFDCECDSVIKIDFKPTKYKNIYKTEDNSAKLIILNNSTSCIIRVKEEKNDCFVKPGKYKWYNNFK
jgi:hypothetical protein